MPSSQRTKSMATGTRAAICAVVAGSARQPVRLQSLLPHGLQARRSAPRLQNGIRLLSYLPLILAAARGLISRAFSSRRCAIFPARRRSDAPEVQREVHLTEDDVGRAGERLDLPHRPASAPP